MKINTLFKALLNPDELRDLISKEDSIFEKLSSKYKASSLDDAEHKFLLLNEYSRSYILTYKDYIDGIVQAVVQNSDKIKRWIELDLEGLTLNSPDEDYTDAFIESEPTVGYNFSKAPVVPNNPFL